jgi:ABC-2 type transport system ATP-binding protein
MSDAVLLQGVRKRFGETEAVKGVNLSVPEGSIYGFIGPNGSGKTTTIRMILRIIEPDEGRIEVLGKPSHPTANDAVAYLPEERGLYRKMKVGAQLTYFGRLKGMSTRDAKREARAWLERLGLEDRWNEKTESLSKGMSQKIQFIATVIARPRLLVLDEPFSGLDPVNLEVIRQSVLELRREGATILFSTHDMGTAEAMCDRIFMIYKGDTVLDGSLAEIRQRYGEDMIRLRLAESDGWNPERVPGVEFCRDIGQSWELRYSGDSQELLREAMQHGRVEQFERTHPSLHDIFVRIARPSESLDETAEGGEEVPS